MEHRSQTPRILGCRLDPRLRPPSHKQLTLVREVPPGTPPGSSLENPPLPCSKDEVSDGAGLHTQTDSDILNRMSTRTARPDVGLRDLSERLFARSGPTALSGSVGAGPVIPLETKRAQLGAEDL